ncbi:MAG: nicotinamide mononucleotide transporter [Clostridia bacterium]|nr:nicotinamide mononucleotide transporter [Clostridia bacterium]
MLLKKGKLFEIISGSVTFILILAMGIIFKQKFLAILPLFISLLVMIMQSRVSSIGFLMGGLNSVLYAIVYVGFGLYASAAYAFFVSFPMQLVTFINWRKRPYGKSTMLRKLSAKQRIFGAIGLIILWFALTAAVNALGGSYGGLDSAVSLIGMVGTLLSMFAFIEYSYFSMGANILSIVLYINMLGSMPEQSTYLVSSAFGLICNARAFLIAHRLYKKQQEEKQ